MNSSEFEQYIAANREQIEAATNDMINLAVKWPPQIACTMAATSLCAMLGHFLKDKQELRDAAIAAIDMALSAGKPAEESPEPEKNEGEP